MRFTNKNALSRRGSAFAMHWALICIVIPLILVFNSINRESITRLTIVFPIMIVMYSGTRLARIVAAGANRVVEMTFWLYVYVFFGLSAFLQVVANRFPWGGIYDEDLVARAFILILAGMAAFDIGYRARFSFPRTEKGSRRATSLRIISLRRVCVIVPISVILSIFATYKLGGLSALFLSRNVRFELISRDYDIAWITILNSVAKTIPYVILVVLLAYRIREGRQRIIITGLIVIVGVLAMVENNPISTARFQVGTLILGVYFVGHTSRRRIKLASYAMIIGLAVVFPYSDLFRVSNDASLIARIHAYAKKSPLAVKVDYDSFQQVMNGLKMTDRNGLRYGKQLLSSAMFWVPRSDWSGKAEPTGVLIAKSEGYSFTNLSAPLWIEFYVDGAWIFMLGGFILYGRAIRILDDARNDSEDRSGMIYLFATIYAGYQVFLLRGSLMPALAYLSPIMPVLWFCTKKHRVRSKACIVGHSWACYD